MPVDNNLQIQQAHRALVQKPSPGATPRSIVVNFLQFETKEMILKKAWQKKIHVVGAKKYSSTMIILQKLFEMKDKKRNEDI